MVYQVRRAYPSSTSENLSIAVSTIGARGPFSVLATKDLPELHLWVDDTPIVPMWTYEPHASGSQPALFAGEQDASASRKHNVTDYALNSYSELDVRIVKEDIFFYVYGILHSVDYRTAYANDLKKSLPRIPKVTSASDFWSFSKAGRQLVALHTEYETVEILPNIAVQLAHGFDPSAVGAYHVSKMKHPKLVDEETGKKVDDLTRIIYNDKITITGIPERVHDYMLGSRSALAWVMESFRIKTDKKSGITNNPNDWSDEHDDPTYILDLVGRVANVSMRTLEIVDALPELDL